KKPQRLRTAQSGDLTDSECAMKRRRPRRFTASHSCTCGASMRPWRFFARHKRDSKSKATTTGLRCSTFIERMSIWLSKLITRHDCLQIRRSNVLKYSEFLPAAYSALFCLPE